MKGTIAALCCAALLGASPEPPAATRAVLFANLTLGMPASGVRAIFGDPLRVLTFHDGAQRTGRYLSADSTGLVVVIEERGYVKGIAAFPVDASAQNAKVFAPDANEIVIGDTLASVENKRLDARKETDEKGTVTIVGRLTPDAGFSYQFANGRVASIYWGTAIPKDAPDLPPLSSPAGDSETTAISVVQNSESTGVDWEYRYLAYHPCDGNTAWKPQGQALLQDDHHSYDRLHVLCPTTKAERDFYFDITAYFGKL